VDGQGQRLKDSLHNMLEEEEEAEVVFTRENRGFRVGRRRQGNGGAVTVSYMVSGVSVRGLRFVSVHAGTRVLGSIARP